MNPSDPDYHIEFFWLSFKQSMINYYKVIGKDYNHIIDWSNKLNSMKAKKEYSIIELTIREYMTLYALDIIKNLNESTHHDDILITNIKRWNHISTLFNFNISIIYSNTLLLFMIYLEIKKIGNLDFLKKLDSIELMLLNTEPQRFDKFIIYAMENDKTKILELLKQIKEYDLIENIKRLYPKMKITNNMRINKICIAYLNYYGRPTIN